MRRFIFLCVIVLALSQPSSAGVTTRLEISGDMLILSYPDSRSPVIFRREGNDSGIQVMPMKIDIPGTWTLDGKASSAPDISCNILWPGVAGRNYSYTMRTSDNKPVKWSVSGLPKGLKFSNGKISGKPSEYGVFSVDVKAESKEGSVVKTLPLKIFADAKPAVITDKLPEAFVNLSYDFKLTINDSPAFILMADKVPEGLTLDNTGRLYGKPASKGEYTFNITAANDAGESSRSLTFKVSSMDIPKPKPEPAPKPKPLPKPKPKNVPKISLSSLKNAYTGEEYSCKLKASSKTPVTWKSDPLPKGLTLNSETGEISGTPSENFKGKINFTATNNEGTSSRQISFIIKTKKPKILTSNLPEGFVSQDYRVDMRAEGGHGITWEFKGKIPEGLSFSKTGVLEGVPKKAGRFTINILAVNSGGKDTGRLPLRIYENIPQDYVTAAVMPVIQVSADGRYNFPVSIDAEIPSGSYIVWHSFPYGVEADGEDYTFRDSNDKEIITVPKNHRLTVSAYLEGGVRYEPVITARVRAKDKIKKAEAAEASGEIKSKYLGCNMSWFTGVLMLALIMKMKQYKATDSP